MLTVSSNEGSASDFEVVRTTDENDPSKANEDLVDDEEAKTAAAEAAEDDEPAGEGLVQNVGPGSTTHGRRAVKLASDNEEVKKLRAEVVKLLNLPFE